MDYWSHKIVGLKSTGLTVAGYHIVQQLIKFILTEETDEYPACKVFLNGKSLTAKPGQIVKVNRIQNDNLKLTYSSHPEVHYVINHRSEPEGTVNIKPAGLSDWLNKIEEYTEDELKGEIESLLNPDFS